MKRITKYILITLTIALVIYLIWYFISIVTYILIAAILSLIGQPLINLIIKVKIYKYRLPRTLGAAITLLLLWAIIFTFFSTIIPTVAHEAKELSEINVNDVLLKIREPIEQIQNFISKFQDGKDFSVTQYAADKIVSVLDVSSISLYLKGFAGTLGDIAIAIFSISFITFFFLKEEKLLRNVILLLVPSKYSEEVTHIMNSTSKLLKRYFIGIGIEVLSVGSLVALGLWIVGLDFEHILIIASFAGIINVIPYIGPLIGGLFGMLIAIITNVDMSFYPELTTLIGFIALVFVSVQIIDNILIQPLIYSNSVNAHPLEIFLVILIAGNIAGIVGMILAIPSYTILRVVAKEFFNNSRIVKQLTSKIKD